MIRTHKWTLGLAAVGLVTIPATMEAEEKLSALQTAVASTTISGYVDTSAQWQFGPGTTPPAYAFNTPSKQDGFNLNVVNVRIEKPFDESDRLTAGYMIDMIYGPNAVGYNTSFGAANGDFGLKQAYVALRAPVGNGLNFKLGSFDSILGYEVFHSGNNPNYTRSWGYTFEPTQHTGLLGAYNITTGVDIAAGVANTANAGINNRAFLAGDKAESDKTVMGGITLTAPKSMGFLEGSTLYGAVVDGFDTSQGAAPSVYPDSKTWWYAGVVLKTPVPTLNVGAAYDHISGAGAWLDANGLEQSAWVQAVSLYLTWQATERLSFKARGEYMWMKDGTAAAMNALSMGEDGTGPRVGIADEIFALTATIQYDLWANVMSRVEFRWDHAADGSEPFNSGDNNAYMLALNVIYKF